MIDNLSDLSTAAWLWLACPGNNSLSQRCSEWSAGFVIERVLVIGFVVMVVFVLAVLWRILTSKKGGGS